MSYITFFFPDNFPPIKLYVSFSIYLKKSFWYNFFTTYI